MCVCVCVCTLHLAPCEQGEVRLEVLSDDGVDGHQAEDAGLADATLCVVIPLEREMAERT